MADERKAYRDRIDALLDRLAEMTVELADAQMRATLAEENAAYSECRFLECMENRE